MLKIQGFKILASMSIRVPASEVDNDAFWGKKVLRTGKKSYYFEYVIRMTGKYPLSKFEVIIPREGVFSNRGSDMIPSPEELADNTYVGEATLEAAGTLNVAMKPYKDRQTCGRLPPPNPRSKTHREPDRAGALVSLAQGALNTKRARDSRREKVAPRQDRLERTEEPVSKRRQPKETLPCSTCNYGSYVLGRGQTRSQCYACCHDPARRTRGSDTPIET